MITICFVKQVPVRVWMLHLLVIAQGLQCPGRYLQLIKDDVKSGSKRTFIGVCNLSKKIFSTTAMLVGVRHLFLGSLTGGDMTTSPISWYSSANE
jgi:hypothetical protein